jgi:RNA polymerase sigma factor (sigma-70 family)
MDSLEDPKRFFLGDIEEEDDDGSLMEKIGEAVRQYRKASRVHGLAVERGITVFTPMIGSEAKSLIPVPITEDHDFEKIIEELIKKYDAELQKYARRFVYHSRESEEVVKDIVQQSWTDAYRSMRNKHWHPITAAVFGYLSQVPSAGKEEPEEEKQANVRAWLYAIVRNNAIEYLMKEKAHPLFPYDPTNDDRECDEIDQPELAFMYKEHRTEIDQALEKLPEQIAKVLSLIIQGYTNVEIARKFNCSPNTVGSHLQRGRKYLPKVLSTKKDMRKRKKPTS